MTALFMFLNFISLWRVLEYVYVEITWNHKCRTQEYMLISLGTYGYFNASFRAHTIWSNALMGSDNSTFKSSRTQCSTLHLGNKKAEKPKSKLKVVSFQIIRMNSMDSSRQRGLTAGKCHKVAWHTHTHTTNSFGERKKQNKTEVHFNSKVHKQK